MRLNKYLASATGMSRRAADDAIAHGRVQINNTPATAGVQVGISDVVTLDGAVVQPPAAHTTIVLHKPRGYVVSRDGQGSPTIYELLPAELHRLKPVGRLDKDSSGLLLLTDDGDLAQQLTHPSSHKIKRYEVVLDKSLQPLHHQMIADFGIALEDGPSKLQLTRIEPVTTETGRHRPETWEVIMHEGRNRQIRRTFAALGYTVTDLHRTHFGQYTLGRIAPGQYIIA